jgi:hypothetical protein
VSGFEFCVPFECYDNVGEVDFFAAEGEGRWVAKLRGEEVCLAGLFVEALDCVFWQEVLYYSCCVSA